MAKSRRPIQTGADIWEQALADLPGPEDQPDSVEGYHRDQEQTPTVFGVDEDGFDWGSCGVIAIAVAGLVWLTDLLLLAWRQQ